MSCYNPHLAVDYGLDPLNAGKHRVKFIPKRADLNIKQARDKYGESLLLLPCGHCIGCIKDYRNQWAVRILLEASLYRENCFITLTYNPTCCPKDMKPHRDEIQRFFKRLLKETGCSIRYFYCGEVGTHGERGENPHYHAILFGYNFPDRYEAGTTKKGSTVYRSPTLEKCWKFGFSSIGDVEPGSACYVAQYCDKKKLTGKDDGSFVGMSRRPGLGSTKFNLRWFKSDTIYCALGEASIPRFYHKLLQGLAPQYYDEWKAGRKARCSQRCGNMYVHGMNEEESYLYDEQVQLLTYIKKARSML